MNINEITEDQYKLLSTISNAHTEVDKYLILLYLKYGMTLTKKEFAEVIKKSQATINRRIKEGYNIPSYLKTSKGKNACYIFTAFEVAKYLSENTIKTK